MIDYEVGKGREHVETEIFVSDCTTAINGISMALTSTRSPADVIHDALRLAYDMGELE